LSITSREVSETVCHQWDLNSQQ